ncbi:MAG: transposase, partial [Thermomicrobiales bacterium]
MRSNSASMCSGANYFISSDGGTTGSGTACWRRSKPRLMPAVRSYGWCASTGQSSKPDRDAEVEHPPDETLGCSRSGRTTKLHLACDGRGRVLAAVLTPGQRHESTQLGPVLDAIRVPRRGGRGRPGSGPTMSSRTRATSIRPAGVYCAAAASRTRSLSGGTSADGARRGPAPARFRHNTQYGAGRHRSI